MKMKILLDYDPSLNLVTMPHPDPDDPAAVDFHLGYVYETTPGFTEAINAATSVLAEAESPSPELPSVDPVALIDSVAKLARAFK